MTPEQDCKPIEEAPQDGSRQWVTRVANGFDDRARAREAMKGIVGKRLTYAQ